LSRETTLHALSSEMAKGSLPHCSVIVCTRARPESLDRCLEALSKLRYTNYEVVVVDSAPIDDSASLIANKWDARYLIQPSPGLSKARNRGASESRSDMVAFLDDDCVPSPDWLSKLLPLFESDPAIMAVTGPILTFRSTEATPGNQRDIVDFGESAIILDSSDSEWFAKTNFGGMGDGGNMAFRRAAVNTWRFDERLGRGALLAGGEEHYALFRLVKAGFKVAYAPEAIVYHPAPRTGTEVRDYANAIAYTGFLFFEHKVYRRAVFRYVVQAVAGSRRSWRRLPPLPARVAMSWWKTGIACLRAIPVLLAIVSQTNHYRMISTGESAASSVCGHPASEEVS